MSEIKIIKGEVEHCDLISEIGERSFIESHGNSASKKDIDAFVLKTYNKEVLLKELKDPDVKYHLIYYKNRVAGYSKIELNTPNTNIAYKNITKLDRFYLLKEYYGQKLGTTLFNFIIDFSERKQQKGVWLAVWIENKKAVRFYTKTGFKIVGKYDFQISETHSNPNHIMFLEG